MVIGEEGDRRWRQEKMEIWRIRSESEENVSQEEMKSDGMFFQNGENWFEVQQMALTVLRS